MPTVGDGFAWGSGMPWEIGVCKSSSAIALISELELETSTETAGCLVNCENAGSGEGDDRADVLLDDG